MLYEKLPKERLYLGLVCLNNYWFMRFFWREDLKLTPSFKQRGVFADTARKKLLCTGRKTFKTGTLEAYVVRSVMQKTSIELEEYLFHTPAQAHLQPVYDRISSKITNTPIFAAMLSGMSETKGVMEFANACKWWFRIEGGSGTGRNMIGIRASRLVGDEGAYSNEAAHRERQLTKTPNCDELWCGVPNGVRGTPFYRADQTIEGKLQGWNRHHLSTLDNPMFWTEKAQADLVADHGGKHTQAYVTQVLGEWGAEAFSSFPPTHIFTETERPYFHYEGADQQVATLIQQGQLAIDSFYTIPEIRGANRWVIGADIGFSPDPTVVGLAYEHNGTWYLLVTIKLLRVIYSHQAAVIDSLNRQVGYKVRKIALDQAGYGKAVADALIHEPVYGGRYEDGLVVNTNFGGRIQDGTKDDKGRPISKPVKQYSTELLKNSLANERMRRRAA